MKQSKWRPSAAELERRRPVWAAMQMLFMGLDVDGELDHIAIECSRSPFTLPELRDIFFKEVFPACRWNLVNPVPQWDGYSEDALKRLILAHHRRHAVMPLLFFRGYARKQWDRLERLVQRNRQGSVA